jgi:hypothetical protein
MIFEDLKLLSYSNLKSKLFKPLGEKMNENSMKEFFCNVFEFYYN